MLFGELCSNYPLATTLPRKFPDLLLPGVGFPQASDDELVGKKNYDQ